MSNDARIDTPRNADGGQKFPNLPSCFVGVGGIVGFLVFSYYQTGGVAPNPIVLTILSFVFYVVATAIALAIQGKVKELMNGGLLVMYFLFFGFALVTLGVISGIFFKWPIPFNI